MSLFWRGRESAAYTRGYRDGIETVDRPAQAAYDQGYRVGFKIGYDTACEYEDRDEALASEDAEVEEAQHAQLPPVSWSRSLTGDEVGEIQAENTRLKQVIAVLRSGRSLPPGPLSATHTRDGI